MLKYTKPSVIAFDFKDALSFEGETGPYVQYAVVRATNIFRKGGYDPDTFNAREHRFRKIPIRRAWKRNLGTLADASAKTAHVVDQCIASTEPAYLAKHAFQLAQAFNTFYHRHPILTEPDAARRRFPASQHCHGAPRADSYSRRSWESPSRPSCSGNTRDLNGLSGTATWTPISASNR